MSSSSLKPPTSPPAQRLSDEDKASEAKSNSEHGAVGAHDERGTLDALISRHGDDSRTSGPIMSSPVDENLFYTAPTKPIDADATVEELQYEEAAAEDMLHPPDFRSFFTMIEDPETGEHHHPTVRYLFSDDDPEILTSAVLDTLDRARDNPHANQQSSEARERCVIVDIAADGKTVASASSMSADWQALKTRITQAPSWGEDNNTADRGLMLKISGRHNGNLGASKEGKRRQEQAGRIDDLVKTYGERLERLDDVIGRN